MGGESGCDESTAFHLTYRDFATRGLNEDGDDSQVLGSETTLLDFRPGAPSTLFELLGRVGMVAPIPAALAGHAASGLRASFGTILSWRREPATAP